jgi:hypothetical protein
MSSGADDSLARRLAAFAERERELERALAAAAEREAASAERERALTVMVARLQLGGSAGAGRGDAAAAANSGRRPAPRTHLVSALMDKKTTASGFALAKSGLDAPVGWMLAAAAFLPEGRIFDEVTAASAEAAEGALDAFLAFRAAPGLAAVVGQHATPHRGHRRLLVSRAQAGVHPQAL